MNNRFFKFLVLVLAFVGSAAWAQNWGPRSLEELIEETLPIFI